MMLKQRRNYFTPANLALAAAAIMGTTQKFALDRSAPLEEMDIICDVTCGATGPTPTGVDGLLAIVKKVNISVNDGVQPRTIVDYSGVGLLEYASLVDDSLDRSTLDIVALNGNGAALANNLKFRLTYRVPLVHPLVTEPLRTLMLLPIHTYPQDPIVTIDFESAANLYSAGSISALVVHYVLKRRDMSIAVTQAIQKGEGFYGFDLIETPFSIGTGISGEQRWAIPTPGSYMNLCFRQYLGGASVTRSPLDNVTTFGSESRWRLETGGVVPMEWRWKQLQIENDRRRSANGIYDPAVFVAATSAGSPTKIGALYPNFPAAPAAGQRWNPEASCLIDFCSPDGDSINELGSVLDCNIPTNVGLKMELVGSVASVATTGSTLFIGGHRLFGSLAARQQVKF